MAMAHWLVIPGARGSGRPLGVHQSMLPLGLWPKHMGWSACWSWGHCYCARAYCLTSTQSGLCIDRSSTQGVSLVVALVSSCNSSKGLVLPRVLFQQSGSSWFSLFSFCSPRMLLLIWNTVQLRALLAAGITWCCNCRPMATHHDLGGELIRPFLCLLLDASETADWPTSQLITKFFNPISQTILFQSYLTGYNFPASEFLISPKRVLTVPRAGSNFPTSGFLISCKQLWSTGQLGALLAAGIT